MLICVLYWNADKGKERFAGSVGTCSDCRGMRQSGGRNVRLLLRSVKKVDELCAGMLQSWYLRPNDMFVGSVCKTHFQNTSRTNVKKALIHNVHSM